VDKSTGKLVAFPAEARDALTEVLREGARRMLASAIEAEVDGYLAAREQLVDDAGHRVIVRNGHLPARKIQTPLGEVAVQQPRVRDRRPPAQRESFHPSVLPPYLRKTKSLEELLPWLYLKGVSTGDFGGVAAGARGAGVVGDDDHAAESGLGRRLQDLADALVGGQAIPVRVGRRCALQHPPRRPRQRPPVHPGRGRRRRRRDRHARVGGDGHAHDDDRRRPRPGLCPRLGLRGILGLWARRMGDSSRRSRGAPGGGHPRDHRLRRTALLARSNAADVLAEFTNLVDDAPPVAVQRRNGVQERDERETRKRECRMRDAPPREDGQSAEEMTHEGAQRSHSGESRHRRSRR
jgi:hypothetical protein